MVDVPNACATIGIPVDMFEFDITPKVGGPVQTRNLGQCAITSHKKKK
jgi:formamidase